MKNIKVEKLLFYHGGKNVAYLEKARNSIVSLLPNDECRRKCLSLFAEVLKKADSLGRNKWGAYYTSEGIRLVVGNLIIFTIHKNGIWLALDKQLLDKMDGKRDLLEKSEYWHWETEEYSEYKPVPSRNGYYVPSKDDSLIWPIIRDFHYEYITKVAKKYRWLNIRSQAKHASDLLAYMRIELGQIIPSPDYGSLSDASIIQDIDEFNMTYTEVSETEREAIVQSRVGQGKFREDLIRYWGKCAVTGCELIKILKASHIKPWRYSSNIERLDKFNGLLLIPNLDSTFDNGLISFDNRVFRSIRSPNTLHADRAIRLNPITDYGLIRSRNSVHGDHL